MTSMLLPRRLMSLLLSFALVLSAELASANAVSLDNVRFKRVSIGDGLSQATVRSITQDAQGFIWLGTQDGLNRYDGNDLRSFYAQDDSEYSLSDNHILSLLAAKNKTGIWVGTLAGGLNYLDLTQEKFARFDLRALTLSMLQQQKRLMDTAFTTQRFAEIGSIQQGALDDLWLGTGAGLIRFDAVQHRVRNFWPLDSVSSVAPLADGNVWLGAGTGLYEMVIDGQQLRKLALPCDANACSVTAIAVEASGNRWVGTQNDGLYLLDSQAQVLRHLRPATANAAGELPSAHVLSIASGQDGMVWVGTLAGVTLIDRAQNKLHQFLADPADPGSMPANRTPSAFLDRDGRVWLGTWTGGVAVHDPRTRALALFRPRKDDPMSMPAGPVRAVWQDPDQSMWLGVMEGGGLVRYNPNKGVVERYRHDPSEPQSLMNDSVLTVYRRRNGELWIANVGAGISVLQANGHFRHLRPMLANQAQSAESRDEPFPSAYVYAFFEDADGTFWAGTDDQGLFVRCARCDRFAPFDLTDGEVVPKSINVLFRAKNNLLWVGSQGGGLMAIDTSTHTARRILADSGQDRISHNSVTDILESKSGALWISTQGGGLNQLRFTGADFKTNRLAVEVFRKADGLGSDAIGSIVEDRTGVIWISTTVGVSALDPERKTIRNLTESDGLDRAGYYIGAKAIAADGSIMFGGLKGLLRFDPSAVVRTATTPKPTITGLRLFNSYVLPSWLDSNSPLIAAPSWLGSLRLKPQQNMVSIEFSDLQFNRSEDARYQYQLMGLSDEWINTTRGQYSATFSNLKAGNYQFRVRAANASHTEFGPLTKLDIQVEPPIWWSWRAKLTYTALGIVSLFGLWLWRSHAQRLKQATLDQIAQSEERLKNALWGSRDELWDVDFETGEFNTRNPLQHLWRSSVTRVSVELFPKWAHPDDQDRVRECLHNHINNRDVDYEVAFRVRTIDDDWAWVLSRGRAVERDANGKAIKLAGTLRDITDVKAAEAELKLVNESLEARVLDRTQDLRASNAELTSTLDALKRAQTQLVESEKMASLGTLVAGVAHEINTPLGIGVTAASHLRQESERIGLRLGSGTLSKSELEEFAKTATESSDLVLRNLDRASKLVKSFKQVAVDQGSEERRLVPLGSYIEEVLIALKPTLRRTAHRVEVNIAADLSIETYPGAISQIVFNLVTNSLTHAFANTDIGLMQFSAERVNGRIELIYRDNGAGLSAEVRKRIFEPFFTTKRGQGGSGLGMNVVYNLVTQLLRGRIRCDGEEGKGIVVTINLPGGLS